MVTSLIDHETLKDGIFKDRIYAPIVDGEVKGHGLVPRDYSIHPKEMFSPPSELQLIPKSEWSDRIKEMAANKSRLSDLRTWSALDQNGQGYCHAEDTEVLTSKGWVSWPNYNGTDLLGTMNPMTGMLEFQSPLARQTFEYDGEMIYSTNRRLDFGVTPNHRMLLRKWDEAKRTLSDRYSFAQAKDIGWYAGVPHATRGHKGLELEVLEVGGDRKYDGDDFIKMLGLLVSDGFAGGVDKTRNLVSFCSFQKELRHDIGALARKLGFKEQSSRKGVWNRWGAGCLAEWVRNNCYASTELKSENKRVPDIVKCASQRQIKLFLHYFNDRTRDGVSYYSASKTLIDDLQELFLKIGKRATISKRGPRESSINGRPIHGKECYVLHVSQTDRLCIERKKHIERERYKGLVYCATVPNGTLVTRRNNSTLISGNCWFYSCTGAVQLVRSIANMPYVRLSAHSGACKIKNFRDEGGWCGLGAKFYREHGCMSVDVWPEKSVDRRYDTPENWETAKQFITTEDYVDLTRDVYDQNLTFDQVATCLLLRIPCVLDFNWWSHSVCGMDLVEVEPGSFGIRILNSWSDNWEDRGTSVLRGSKAIPNGALAIRVAHASDLLKVGVYDPQLTNPV